MKELSIEEKAKAYDEAIEKASVAHKDEDRHLKATLERIFPELAESEDERIRKQIKAFIKSRGSQITQSKTDGWLAWLKKQGEQKASYTTIVKTGDGGINALVTRELPTDGEQNPTDKVEPKFKVGDIIRHKKQGFTCKIDAIDTEYRVSDCCGTHLPFDMQDYYELVEQKHVDATPTNEDKVRKKVKEIFDSCEKIDVSEMEKNRAAFGLLELEAFADIFYKIGKEQKQTEWSEEDEGWLDNAIVSCEQCGNTDTADWLKSIKERVQPQQKQEWSEEDKMELDSIIYAIERNYELANKQKEWLKSLRPQKKQEWSKDDEIILEGIIGAVSNQKPLNKYQLEWLNSLRPQKLSNMERIGSRVMSR